jgi:pilus assembly protein CpaB
MRGRAIVPLVVGLGVGFVALKVFVNVLQKAKAATPETVSVVYAAANIEPTLEITESMIEVRQVPKEAVPDTGFRDKKEVVGRVTSWPIPKGSPIGEMQLAAKGTPPGMAVRIANGFRAVAVKIDESAGVAGWIKPGSRVDVVALLSSPERGSSESMSKVILQNVEVLAVGQDIGKAGDTAANVTKTITLLVAPVDVPKLHLAETKGKLRLAMRNQQDSGMAKANLTTDNDLLSLNAAAPASTESTAASFLRAFMSKQPKSASERTDKDQQSMPAPTASGQEATSAPESCVVELYKGLDDVESVKFERRTQVWQRTEGQDARPGRTRAAAPAASPMPSRLIQPAQLPAAISSPDLNAKPQAKGPEPEGPARTQ